MVEEGRQVVVVMRFPFEAETVFRLIRDGENALDEVVKERCVMDNVGVCV
jgi:hypothetical protein